MSARRLNWLVLAGSTVLTILAAWLVVQVLGLISAVLIPVALALLLAGLLMPVQVILNHRLRLPRHLGAAICVLMLTSGVLAIFWIAGAQLAAEAAGLRESTVAAISGLEEMILASPIPVEREQLASIVNQTQGWVLGNSDQIMTQVMRVGSTTAGLAAGATLSLVSAFFFLADGDRMWAWFVERLPLDRRRRMHEAFRRGWVTLGTYAKMQVIVAGVDAVGIGTGAAVLGLPFVLALTAVVFLLCFIPILGAFLSGALVVLVALATKGVSTAIIMLLIVLAVQQLEGNVLSPYLMGRAVSLHPLLVILGVAGGSYLAGLVGALFTVPFLAVANTVWRYLSGDDMFPGLASGGSALTDSARKLSNGRWERPVPRLVGDARPWLSEPDSTVLVRVDDEPPRALGGRGAVRVNRADVERWLNQARPRSSAWVRKQRESFRSRRSRARSRSSRRSSP